MYKITRTDEEIDDLRSSVSEQIEKGAAKYPGMSYEQGIADVIAWLVGDTEDHPYDE